MFKPVIAASTDSSSSNQAKHTDYTTVYLFHEMYICPRLFIKLIGVHKQCPDVVSFKTIPTQHTTIVTCRHLLYLVRDDKNIENGSKTNNRRVFLKRGFF